MKTRFIPATEFKAKCLALLDEVQQEGGSITVTKRGRPVATVMPAKKPGWKSSTGILAGTFSKAECEAIDEILTKGFAHLYETD